MAGCTLPREVLHEIPTLSSRMRRFSTHLLSNPRLAQIFSFEGILYVMSRNLGGSIHFDGISESAPAQTTS